MTAPWELYNLDEDFTQARDIAADNPEKLEELKALCGPRHRGTRRCRSTGAVPSASAPS
ncbi:MAG: hypothetical protein R3C69_11590 [Geminicoccaceae bacterium]